MKPLPSFILPAAGAYLVGGCVRDLLLGRSPTDYDVAVEDSPAEYAATVAAVLRGRVVELGKPGARTWRVAATGRVVDVSAIQGAGIRDDLLRRDFSINAMGVGTVNGELLDVAGGREDLAHRTIRMVSRSVFRTDPVRLIRAFRFAAQLGFSIEAGTRDAVRNDAGLIARTAGERIRDEFYKLTGGDHHVSAVADMAATGLLTAVFPELASRSPASTHGAVEALRELDGLCSGVTARAGAEIRRVLQGFNAHRRVLLRCGLMFHPLGAPGAEPEREAVFDRLRCPNRDRGHLGRLLTLQDMPLRLFATAPATTPRDEIRFFLVAGDSVPDLFLQEVAWARSDESATAERTAAFEQYTGRLLRRYVEDYCPRRSMPSPVTGDDLMAEFGLRPSPMIRDLLRAVEEERLTQRTFSRADALQLVRRALAQKTSSPPAGEEEL
jgi:poly(A) polymerase